MARFLPTRSIRKGAGRSGCSKQTFFHGDKKEIFTVDLFCGAGGASTGLEEALKRKQMKHKGLAINHWAVAVDTMKRNHPDIDTKQMSIEEAVPADLVPGGEVDLMWASPSCTHHSRAKGGKPRDNQLRAQPELVLTWLDQLRVRRIIIENVPEFVQWAPLGFDKKPLKSKITWMDARDICCAGSGRVKVGSSFAAWVASIKARNYDVEWKIVNCADYGDATSRRRFFLKAVRRGCGKIRWPEPTHAENPQPDLFGTLKPWRGVRECLDLTDTGRSIFNRKKPLAQNTLRRIMVGLRKFNGLDFQMDWLDARGKDNCRLRNLDKPLFAQPTWNRTWLVRPFVVRLNNNCDVEDVDSPLSTVTTSGAHHMICQPLVVDFTRNGKAKPANEPIGSQHCNDRFGIITPLIMGQQSCAAAKPIDEPCPTIATGGAVRMITPLILDMSRPGGNDSGHIRPANKPIQTLTTCDNVQGVFPMLEDGRLIDIRIRMLKPSELAKAHSFPDDYRLTGNRGEQVKQIGNSVPVMTACAMCEADLEGVH